MIYPTDFEEQIGFSTIKDLLKTECYGQLGQELVDRIRFKTDYAAVMQQLARVEELRTIMMNAQEYPGIRYEDIRPILSRTKITGTFLLGEEFKKLAYTLRAYDELRRFFIADIETAYPKLYKLVHSISLDSYLLKTIDHSIDESGAIRNDASNELKAIRTKLYKEQEVLRKRVDYIIKDLREKKQSPDDLNPTIRDGRLVLPVYSEFKRQVKGIIHDISASGKTSFVEPTAFVEANNIIRELQVQESYEINRILFALTEEIRPYLSLLYELVNLLSDLDLVRASARFARSIQAVLPKVQEQPTINWKKAVHPILFLKHQESDKPIVDQDIELTDGKRLVVISGPNAGGKSITLKTVGLLQYMLQCGLLISCDAKSEFGLFQKILVDVGDNQSLEDDLSTYSSHLTALKTFLEEADAQSLVLIDEFGAGTDPEFGASIAEVVLGRIVDSQSYGVITTHYSSLKYFAEKHPSVINAAMRFDIQQLEPKYKLVLGRPGSSFALEIARKTGIPSDLLDQAKTKIGKQKIDFERIIAEIQEEKSLLEEQRKALQAEQTKIHGERVRYETLSKHFEKNRKELINQAKIQAGTLLKDANKKIERIIQGIKESEADKETVRDLRNELTSLQEEIKPDLTLTSNQSVADSEGYDAVESQPEVGSLVEITGSGAVGKVESLDQKKAVVAIGELRTTVDRDRIKAVSKRASKKKKPFVQRKASTQSVGSNIGSKALDFNRKIDLRGMRAEEALTQLEHFVDDALMLNQSELEIVHGKGDGVLRSVVRDYLHRLKEAENIRAEHADRGGEGVTLVTLTS